MPKENQQETKKFVILINVSIIEESEDPKLEKKVFARYLYGDKLVAPYGDKCPW